MHVNLIVVCTAMDLQQQAVHIMDDSSEVVSSKVRAKTVLIYAGDSAHDLSVKLGPCKL